jgi:hypothetical protein
MAEDPNPTVQTTDPITTPGSANETNNGDAELKAINVVVTALSPLNEEQRTRALDYVLRRFNIASLQTSAPRTPLTVTPAYPSSPASDVIQPHTSAPGAIHDIRTLKETKAPKTAIEMAALVAYYVSELAPPADRKNEVTKSDIERYFKAAGFNLPADASFTLVNAKNAGYIDSAGTGQYKLNPVGYNLVAHRMGNREAEKKERGRGRKAGTKRRPNSAKKTSRAKK